ncbi:DUF3857 domain-containing transglutaminase family protein [Mesorhizobium sp. NPDC059025]|uniref:DUF3857 domain-containing transglutaminase family protein n=1 Tax=unclassified Mesorhizobium TaxID=325217 RepID=UPI003699810E
MADAVTVEADGRSVMEWEMTRRLLDASGRDDFAKKTFSFNDKLASVDILEAETIKADGRRIKIQPDQIRLQEDPAAVGSPVFSTSKLKTIIFPDIEVGDNIRYRVRKTIRVPDFPGQFSYEDNFSPVERVLSFKLVVKAPASLNLRTDVKGFEEVRGIGPSGEQIWNWTFTQPETRPIDDGKVDMFLAEPHVAITSFQNWKAIAAAYDERAKDKVVVTPEIQALADELTKGVSDRHEQTRRLYDWVRGNIRYVALYLANGGYVPHAAADILKNRYGDCKDHVVLLEALLRAKGIESNGALISSAADFDLGPVASPSVFNHVITYVPEFDLYLDATQQYLPFGQLGYWVSGKPVLHVGVNGKVERTPSLTAESNKRKTSMQLEFALDGSMHGQIEEISSGAIALYRRNVVAGVDPLQRKDAIKILFQQAGLNGKGSYEADDPANNNADYRTKIDFEADQTGLDLTRPEAISIELPFQLAYAISDLTSFVNNRPEPLFSDACEALDLGDDYSITLPKGVGVQALPKPRSILEGPIRYESNYAVEGQTIRVHRQYTMTLDRGYCTPQEMADLKKTATVVRRDVQSKIVLTPISN